jgi:hypothetical protein
VSRASASARARIGPALADQLTGGMSGSVCAGAQSFGGSNADIGALSGCALLEFVQRGGINRDIQAHLGAVRIAVYAQRLARVEEVVQLVGGDLVVVHGYMMLV